MSDRVRRMRLAEMPPMIYTLFTVGSTLPVAVVLVFADNSTLRYEVES